MPVTNITEVELDCPFDHNIADDGSYTPTGWHPGTCEASITPTTVHPIITLDQVLPHLIQSVRSGANL